jgi:hypothetical protein
MLIKPAIVFWHAAAAAIIKKPAGLFKHGGRMLSVVTCFYIQHGRGAGSCAGWSETVFLSQTKDFTVNTTGASGTNGIARK